MTKLYRHLNTEVHEWRMTEAEKRAMRGSLEAHMSAHPLGGMRSPYSWVSFVHMRSMVLVPILILMLGSGTAFAAQGALPGDALYSIKIHVNEAVADALAVSDEAKASYNTKVAAERLKEAQALAAENKLSAETTDTLAQNYEAHATLAVAYADKVESGDAVKGAELHASLASLKAEGEVLATVAGKDGSQETKHNATTLASRAGASGPRDDGPAQGAVAMAMTMAAPAEAPSAKGFAMQTLSVTVDTGDSARSAGSASANDIDTHVSDKAVASLEARATEQLASLRELAGKQTKLDASTSAALTARLDDLQALIDSAKDSSGSDALRLYQRALSEGTVLKTFLSASKKFKLDILVPLLHVRGDSSGAEPSSSHSGPDRWDSDNNDRHGGDGDQSATTTPDADSRAPAGAASSAVNASVTPPPAASESTIPAPNTEGQSSGSSGTTGSGGSPVRDLIQTVTNGLHL
jgi:hypothetical protein